MSRNDHFDYMLSRRSNHHPGKVCSATRLLAVLVLGGVITFSTPTGLAQQLKTTAGIGLTATFSDNVNLGSGSDKQADFYTTVSPRVGLTYDGPRLKFTGTYSPSAVIYASNSDSNSWFNSLSATGTLTAIDNFFYIDASVLISQQFLSGFAPIPVDLGNITGNRVETRTYALSPYFKGTTESGLSYELRNRIVYVEPDTSSLSNTQFVEWLATADKTIGVYSIGADYSYQESSYTAQNTLITQVARLRLGYQINPELRLTIRGGYETNNYFISNDSGVIYGAGLDATPTPRSSVSGYWEHRFFGDSYSLTASHRRRLTAFTLSGSRQLSTYPQALLAIPPGNTTALLDAALTARIPDPVQRQAFINQFIQQTGLPPTLLNPFTYFTNTVSLVNTVSGSIALLGVRNSIVFTAFRASSENIGQPGVALPPALTLNTNYTSSGAAAAYSYTVSPKTTLNATLSRTYTKSNDQTNTIKTTQDLLLLVITTQLSIKTNGSVGVRTQHIESTVVPAAIEHAIFATLDHRF